jgi:LPXTG-motif cell wall-anchored protein
MLRRFVFVLGALFLAGLGFSLPAHAGYTPDDAAISVSPSSVAAGGTATVSGTGCAADVDVTITLGDTEAATATTDEDGAFSASVTVPSGAAPGPYTIEADGCSATVLSTTLTVTAAGTGTTGGTGGTGGTTLPQTGSDSTETLLRVGVVLVAAGGLLAFAARRRTASATR